MLLTSLSKLLLLPAVLRTALAQNTTSSSSGACNNDPSLCSRQYNEITHLGAHDSPYLRDESTRFSTSGNQYFNTTIQLSAGVRLLTTQVHSRNGEWHLCHTSCDLLDAGTLSDWLGEIRDWMEDNPNDVVTVLLVNSNDASASDLAGEYEAAGITQYSYTPSSTEGTLEWPTLQELINADTRLLTFVASLDDNAAAPYLLDQFNYIFENDYDNTQFSDFSCAPSRPSSVSGDASSAISQGLMPLMNHFLYEEQGFGLQVPDEGNVTTTNAPGSEVGMLGRAADECTSQYGRAPTFILVDFFNVGPAIETVDALNQVSNPVGRRSVPETVQTQSSAASGMVRVTASWGCLIVAAMLVSGAA
ncbi:hypothetical protein MBLNU230_g6851t1 [Neophaeotheca triangularis]